MAVIIVVLGNEDELFGLASSLDKKYCNSTAHICMHNAIPEQNNFDTIFLVGHADISSLGDYTVNNISSIVSNFNSNLGTKIFLAGCSTGNANQQLLNNGFVAGLPLASKIHQLKPKVDIYVTQSTLCRRKSDGELFLTPSLNQGITESSPIFTKCVFKQ